MENLSANQQLFVVNILLHCGIRYYRSIRKRFVLFLFIGVKLSNNK